ncbi:MAG: hypothetical protein ACXWOV_14700 [Isosphaeraceae bacterium]
MRSDRRGRSGDNFLQKLKAAPAGTSADSLIMDAIGSAPADQLKAALTNSTAKEHGVLFGAVPADQIKSIIGSLPTSVLAPADPPPPAPPPTGGPSASILQTTYQNVPYPPPE